jgi:RNA-directed DNA polymerase
MFTNTNRIAELAKEDPKRQDLKNFFGSLSHAWMLRFVEHRVGDPRLISLIRRWLKANILENEELHANEEGTPQGGSISVLLSNVYLHYGAPG